MSKRVVLAMSGGVDSSYMAYLAKQWGLRPLIVHFDNGWNDELAVCNIESIVKSLGFRLETFVMNWPEFRDLQRSYFLASVLDLELSFWTLELVTKKPTPNVTHIPEVDFIISRLANAASIDTVTVSGKVHPSRSGLSLVALR